MISTSKKKLDNTYLIDEAILNGLAPDGELWIPEKIPKLKKDFLNNIEYLSDTELCIQILELYFSPSLSNDIIKKIVEKSINFEIPLVKLNENNYILELIHGPTQAFKDFGARIMAQIFDYLINSKTSSEKTKYKVFVATSGDTGGAVANAFSSTNVPVYIFYPKNKISIYQEKQITRYGKNITCLSVEGNFDDCQNIVKKLISDTEIKKNNIKLITANSINISRLIPQIFYYFTCYRDIKKIYGKNIDNYKIIFSIPSGNFGNATAAFMSKLMGLPIHKIMIATNINNTLAKFLKNGCFDFCKSIETISNAMDVGNPSNLKRIWALCDHDYKLISDYFLTDSITDLDTKKMIKEIFIKYNYLIDPHTAVGLKSIYNHKTDNSQKNINITLSTASPYKFKNIVEDAINKVITEPPEFKIISKFKSMKLTMHDNEINILKKIILNGVIVLIGMPGTGKSTIAKNLSNKYNWNVIETDELIINKYNMKLVDIVNMLGDNFKSIEKETILNIKNIPSKSIISTGGSVVYCNETMNHLSKLGTIIHLDCTVDDLKLRINNYLERGIVMKPGETISDLYNNRKILYQKYRELSINNSILDINETAELINNLF